ncbi:DMT family transporter [Halalkalibacillus halophilus]|uniref:DMT family transporter n=1 Tax=Halalkalibacillus halophilus TaxID=392827 RepID=UPI000406DB4F|nr:SMR family transporter [Halalkalibacillus halophilus]
MQLAWIKVFVGAFFEILWVVGLKHASTFPEWIATSLAIIISFYLLIMASKILPVGTAYAVFVGIGAAGTVVIEILFFGVPFQWEKLVFIILLLIGIIGLKLVSERLERSEV